MKIPGNLIALILFIGLVVFFLKVMLPRWFGRNSVSPVQYQKAPALLSAAERSFYDVLRLAVQGQYMIFAKVRMLDVIRPDQADQNYQAAKNKVSQKHLDFVLCAPTTIAPELVIELDDRSHLEGRRQIRDVFVDEALRSADLAVLRFPARAKYDIQELKGSIEKVLGRPGSLTTGEQLPVQSNRAASRSNPLPSVRH